LSSTFEEMESVSVALTPLLVCRTRTLGTAAADHRPSTRQYAHKGGIRCDGGKWDEELYNAVGFPRVFYLRYHGYSAYFPLWALARYQDLMARNDRRVAWGM
jgi:squalene cyclase